MPQTRSNRRKGKAGRPKGPKTHQHCIDVDKDTAEAFGKECRSRRLPQTVIVDALLRMFNDGELDGKLGEPNGWDGTKRDWNKRDTKKKSWCMEFRPKRLKAFKAQCRQINMTQSFVMARLMELFTSGELDGDFVL